MENRALGALADDRKSLPCNGPIVILVNYSLNELNLLVYWKQNSYSGYILQPQKDPTPHLRVYSLFCDVSGFFLYTCDLAELGTMLNTLQATFVRESRKNG